MPQVDNHIALGLQPARLKRGVVFKQADRGGTGQDDQRRPRPQRKASEFKQDNASGTGAENHWISIASNKFFQHGDPLGVQGYAA